MGELHGLDGSIDAGVNPVNCFSKGEVAGLTERPDKYQRSELLLRAAPFSALENPGEQGEVRSEYQAINQIGPTPKSGVAHGEWLRQRGSSVEWTELNLKGSGLSGRSPPPTQTEAARQTLIPQFPLFVLLLGPLRPLGIETSCAFNPVRKNLRVMIPEHCRCYVRDGIE